MTTTESAAPRTYTVEGMSCSHCAASLREEVSQVTGVDDVTVEVDSGRVVVAGDGFSDVAIAAAVEEAGYRVAAC